MSKVDVLATEVLRVKNLIIDAIEASKGINGIDVSKLGLATKDLWYYQNRNVVSIINDLLIIPAERLSCEDLLKILKQTEK